MLLNNFDAEVRDILGRERFAQTDIARKLNITKSAVSKLWSGKVVNDGIVRLMDVMGYDVKVVYVKRKEEKEELPDYIIEEK